MEKSSTRVCFIVNPAAGKEDTGQLLQLIRREAVKRWMHFEIIDIRPEESVAGLSSRKAGHFDLIVACGGDGTVNSVVNGIAESDSILGVLPIGTGNDFAKAIGVHCSILDCFDVLYSGTVNQADLIHYSGDYEGWSANTLGVGLDGLANHFAISYRKLSGPVIYILGALKAAWAFRGSRINLTIDGKSFTNHYLMVTSCNGNREGGTFYLAPEASVFDGKLNLVTIKELPFIKILFYLPFFRWGPAPWMKELETIMCRDIELESDRPLSVHADGEHVGSDIKNLKILLHPGKLRVITGY